MKLFFYLLLALIGFSQSAPQPEASWSSLFKVPPKAEVTQPVAIQNRPGGFAGSAGNTGAYSTPVQDGDYATYIRENSVPVSESGLDVNTSESPEPVVINFRPSFTPESVFGKKDFETFLDYGGLSPGPEGMGIDAAGVIYYLIDGQWVNAGLTAAAFVPFLGQAPGAYKIALKIEQAAEAAKAAGGKAVEAAGELASNVAGEAVTNAAVTATSVVVDTASNAANTATALSTDLYVRAGNIFSNKNIEIWSLPTAATGLSRGDEVLLFGEIPATVGETQFINFGKSYLQKYDLPNGGSIITPSGPVSSAQMNTFTRRVREEKNVYNLTGAHGDPLGNMTEDLPTFFDDLDRSPKSPHYNTPHLLQRDPKRLLETLANDEVTVVNICYGEACMTKALDSLKE